MLSAHVRALPCAACAACTVAFPTPVFAGAPNKKWVFGHTLERELGRAYGCPRKGWKYACILIWKTSADGTHMKRAKPIKYQSAVPTKDEMERAMQKVAAQRVELPARYRNHDEL